MTRSSEALHSERQPHAYDACYARVYGHDLTRAGAGLGEAEPGAGAAGSGAVGRRLDLVRLNSAVVWLGV
jgi:hypothetical protein